MKVPSQVYKYLEVQALQQKEVRQTLIHPQASANQRKDVLLALNDVVLHFNGYFRALEQVYGYEVAKHLKEYFEQAGSDEGLRHAEKIEAKF